MTRLATGLAALLLAGMAVGQEEGAPRTLSGELIDIHHDLGMLKVRPAEGKPRSLYVARRLRVAVDGREARPTRLRRGMQVTFRLTPGGEVVLAVDARTVPGADVLLDFSAMDGDKDGKISRAEIDAFLKRFDGDGDGALDLDEIAPVSSRAGEREGGERTRERSAREGVVDEDGVPRRDRDGDRREDGDRPRERGPERDREDG